MNDWLGLSELGTGRDLEPVICARVKAWRHSTQNQTFFFFSHAWSVYWSHVVPLRPARGRRKIILFESLSGEQGNE